MATQRFKTRGLTGDFPGTRPTPAKPGLGTTTPTPASPGPGTSGDTPDITAASPPAGAEGGATLGPVAAIAIGTAAAGLIQGILAQRNAAKNREFTAEQNQLAAEEARRARREQNVQGAISNIGSRAAQGAQQQGSALSGLAGLFGGLA